MGAAQGFLSSKILPVCLQSRKHFPRVPGFAVPDSSAGEPRTPFPGKGAVGESLPAGRAGCAGCGRCAGLRYAGQLRRGAAEPEAAPQVSAGDMAPSPPPEPQPTSPRPVAPSPPPQETPRLLPQPARGWANSEQHGHCLHPY